MKILNLVDRCFEGSDSSTNFQSLPAGYQWDRSCSDKDRITVYSNIDAFLSPVTDPSKAVAWLFESIEVMPFMFMAAPSVLNKFRTIYTYYLPFINTWPDKFKYIPAMGGWLKESETLLLQDKTKFLSMICSSKKNTFSQAMRHDLAEKLHKDGILDIYGPEFKPLENKADALAPYQFSIVMENGVQPGYFTEKLIDCFIARTLPIYYGDCNLNYMASRYGIKLAGIISFRDWSNDPTILEKYLNNPKIGDIIESNREAALKHLHRTPEVKIFEDLYAN